MLTGGALSSIAERSAYGNQRKQASAQLPRLVDANAGIRRLATLGMA